MIWRYWTWRLSPVPSLFVLSPGTNQALCNNLFVKKISKDMPLKCNHILKDTQGENAPSSVYKKYEYEYLGNWYMKLTFYKRFLCLNQFFKKNKEVSGNNPFFVIGPFSTSHSIFLNIGFWRGNFVRKCFALNRKYRKLKRDAFNPLVPDERNFVFLLALKWNL